MHMLHQRAGHAHRKIEPRHRQGPMVGVEKVVQHVYAGTVGDAAVHHAHFAVQTPPAAGEKHSEPPQRRKNPPCHTTAVKTLGPLRRQAGRAETIHREVDPDAAQRRALERTRYQTARRIQVEDIGLKADFMLAGVELRDQRREILLPALQQLHLVGRIQTRR